MGVPRSRILLGLLLLLAVSLPIALWQLAATRQGPRSPRATHGNWGDAPASRALEAEESLPATAGPPGPVRSDGQRVAEEPQPSDAGTHSDPGTTLGGLVHCADRPIAGATVRLLPRYGTPAEGQLPRAETRTDEDGHFRFTGLLPHERFGLFAQAENWLPRTVMTFSGLETDIELAPSVRVSGRVLLAESRAPLAGVEVALRRELFGSEGYRRWVSTRSDESGRFELAWARAGIERLFLTRPGGVPETFEIQVPEGGAEGYEILLPRATRTIVVVDLESGAPLADTEIVCLDRPTRTDAWGNIVLPASLGGDSITLTVGYPGDMVTRARRASTETALRIPIARGGRVRGRVVDADGAPVAGARVVLAGGGKGPPVLALPDGIALESPSDAVSSDEDGAFLLCGLPPRASEARVRAQHPEWPNAFSDPFPFALLGAQIEAAIRLERGATIQGHVTLDGEPASLRVSFESSRGGRGTRSDTRGAFRLTGVPAGTVQLLARTDLERDGDSLPEDVILEVEDGATIEQDLARHSQATVLAGHVLDESGRPLAGVRVTAEGNSASAPSTRRERAESGADGSFEIAVLNLGDATFRVTATEGARSVELREIAPGTRELVLVLPNWAQASIEVLDARTRAPIPSFLLYWRFQEPTPIASGGQDGDLRQAGWAWERLRLAGHSPAPGPDGRFLAELPAGRLELVVRAEPGYAPSDVEEVDLRPGQLGRPVRFLLERGATLELELLATDSDDDARKQVERTLRKERLAVASESQWQDRARGGALYRDCVRGSQSGVTGPDGRLVLRGLAPGPYRLTQTPRSLRLAPTRFTLPPVEQHHVRIAAKAARPRGKPAPGKR